MNIKCSKMGYMGGAGGRRAKRKQFNYSLKDKLIIIITD